MFPECSLFLSAGLRSEANKEQGQHVRLGGALSTDADVSDAGVADVLSTSFDTGDALPGDDAVVLAALRGDPAR